MEEWAPGCQCSRWTALRLIVPEIGQRGLHRQTGMAVADQQRAAFPASPSKKKKTDVLLYLFQKIRIECNTQMLNGK